MQQKPPANRYSIEDKILWQRVTQNLTPLPNRQKEISQPNPNDKTIAALNVENKKSQKSVRLTTQSMRTVSQKPLDLRVGDHAGLDARTQRRLSRGDIPIERRLDLHGHTAKQAQVSLRSFIEDASNSGSRCVLVITGKGTGVLRSHVPDWLKRSPLSRLVLALAEARQADGGSGAFYVLLRRRR
ncbi:MAG: Smr/MutS family protein [Candidatus Puniceispirillaceae bacterium]